MRKLLLLILVPTLVKAQFCSTTTLVNMGVITPTTTWQNVTGAASAKRYWTFNATAGCTYDFSTCNSVNSNDTYLRLYSGTNPITAILQTLNDDNGPWCSGLKASLNWTCGTTGVYSILLTNYSCANLSASTILSYRTTCSTLPIELLWFRGYVQEDIVKLKWATATEINNDYFIVQKFVENEWVDMTRVEGVGTTNFTSYYETQDTRPTIGYSYYRLKQVDHDGQYEIFAPIVIYMPPIENRKILMVYDLLGRQIENLDTFTGVFFILYEDGRIEKKIK